MILLVATPEAAHRHVQQVRRIDAYRTVSTVRDADSALPGDEVRWLADPGLDAETVAAIEERLKKRGAL